MSSPVLFAAIYVVLVTGRKSYRVTPQGSLWPHAFATISGYTSAVLTTSYGGEPLDGGDARKLRELAVL